MNYFHRLKLPNLLLAIISTLCILGLWLQPIHALEKGKAPVVLDGQPIFQINETEQLTAQDRADLVNFQIKSAMQSALPVKVSLEQRNQLPVIFLNDRYLLTVTERDATEGLTADEQAKIWVQKIQIAAQKAQVEHSQEYSQNMLVLSMGILLGAIALSWGLGWLRRYLAGIAKQKWVSTDSETIPKGMELFFKLTLAIARTCVWVVAVLYVANLFPISRTLSYQIQNILLSSFASPLLTLGKSSYSVIDLLVLILLLSGVVFLARTSTNILRERFLNLAGLSRGAQEAIAVLAQYSIIFIGALVLLQVWGLDLSSLTILASALGIGLGIGLQNIAKNFGSGLIIVFERPIQVGDFIEVGKLNGTVERIGARSTEIRTLDQVSIIVPNSRFLDDEVINWSHRNPISRLHLPLGVSYSADPNQVRSALLEAAISHSKVLSNPAPQVLFKGFGDSALDFELLVWTSEPDKQFILKSDLYFCIFAVLTEHKIEIPFPQRDLNIRSGKLELSPQIESALIEIAKLAKKDVCESGKLGESL